MKRLAALLLLTAPLFAGTPALAQIAPSSNAPVDVTADELEVQNSQCLAIWRGSAEALQEQSRLRANVLNIYNKQRAGGSRQTGPNLGGGGNCGTLDRMEADGNVYYVTPTQVIKGDHAVYLADSRTITVTGDVVATQGKNVLTGARLVVNTDTGQATMVSSVQGRGKSGRVRGVFYPNQGSAPAARP